MEGMDELATKLVDSMAKVENALETMAPTAFRALIEAASIEGTLGFVGVLMLIIIFMLSIIGVVVARRLGNEPLMVASCVGGFMSGMLGGVFIFSSPLVLKIINPTAYVIKHLLGQ